MKMFRRLLIGMALSMGFVGTLSHPTPAVAAKKPHQLDILRYNELYRQQLRFFTFQGFVIIEKLSDPIARQGSFQAVVFDADFAVVFGYLVEINGKKVTYTLF